MFCGNCGKQIQDNAAVCPHCGAPTGVAQEAQPQYRTPAQPYNQNGYGGQAQPYNQNGYGGQAQPYNQSNYGGQAQPYNQNNYGGQAQPYNQKGYSAPNYGSYKAYNTDPFPENGFDSVNKVVLAKLGVVDNRPITHQFQRLGGFLAVATYMWAVMALVLAYTTIQVLTSVSRVNSDLGSIIGDYGGYTSTISGYTILFLILMCGVVTVNVLMFIFMQKKNPVFLKFYEIVSIVVVALAVLLTIVIMSNLSGMGGFSGYARSMVWGVLFPILFWTVVIHALWILYFAKSVRIRTYFGTDEYLRRSIFCKKSYPLPLVPDRPVM